MQRDLEVLGFSPGPVDGVIGRQTRAAVISFQVQMGAPATGELTPYERSVLRNAAMIHRQSQGGDPAVAIARAFGGESGYGGPALAGRPQPARAAASIAPQAAAPPISGPAVPSRKFVAWTEHPPEGFRGYGIVAFKSVSTDYDRDRHKMICEAYAASFLNVSALRVPNRDQFVTVWPVQTAQIAETTNLTNDRERACQIAVASYDLAMSQNTIRAARAAGFDDQGVGPFLLGWLPATKFGEKDALILSLDMSRVETYAQARALIEDWKHDIENDPDLLGQTLTVEGLRKKIRRWADQHGEGIFSIILGG
ncbi:MAG: peptidoglycan-binding domain-containing protein [Pseudomonadota bacterium]